VCDPSTTWTPINAAQENRRLGGSPLRLPLRGKGGGKWPGLYMPRAGGDSCGSLGSYALVDGTIYGTCDSRLYDRSKGLTFHYMDSDFPRRFISTVHVRLISVVHGSSSRRNPRGGGRERALLGTIHNGGSRAAPAESEKSTAVPVRTRGKFTRVANQRLKVYTPSVRSHISSALSSKFKRPCSCLRPWREGGK